MLSSAGHAWRHSTKWRALTGSEGYRRAMLGITSRILTRRSGWAYGRGLSRMPLTSEKTALVAPKPNPSMRMAGTVNPGSRARDRAAWLRSLGSFM